MRYFLEKKSPCSEPSGPRNLTHTNYTATKRYNFVAHKKSILISKIWGDFSALSLCDIAPSLHLVWQRH